MRWLGRRPVVVEPARRDGDRIVARLAVGRTTRDVAFRLDGREPNELDDPFVPVAALFAAGLSYQDDLVPEDGHRVSEFLNVNATVHRDDLGFRCAYDQD